MMNTTRLDLVSFKFLKKLLNFFRDRSKRISDPAQDRQGGGALEPAGRVSQRGLPDPDSVLGQDADGSTDLRSSQGLPDGDGPAGRQSRSVVCRRK